jgi:hypothetical protein
MRAKPLQKYKNKAVTEGYTPKPIKVTNLKTAKRLLSKLIYDLQINQIDSKLAKDLTYLVSVFVNIYKESDLETKINEYPPIEIRLKAD